MNIKALLILAVFIAASCRSNDDDMVESTYNAIEINSDLFNNGITDEFEIMEVKISDNCLSISLGFGGGCEEVKASLVALDDDNRFLNNASVRIVFEDDDFCEAFIVEEFLFDLTPLQENDTNSIEIILQDFSDNPIVYEY